MFKRRNENNKNNKNNKTRLKCFEWIKNVNEINDNFTFEEITWAFFVIFCSLFILFRISNIQVDLYFVDSCCFNVSSVFNLEDYIKRRFFLFIFLHFSYFILDFLDRVALQSQIKYSKISHMFGFLNVWDSCVKHLLRLVQRN